MYKVVLVDDELWALRGIEKIFPWSEYGFEIIAKCTDGQEALSIIHNTSVDVVFTDIKMSGYSGLELMKAVKKSNKKVKFIVISAYRDFEYAQKAMEYGASFYLLKPVTAEQAKNTLEQLKEDLNDDFRIEKISENLGLQWGEIVNIDSPRFAEIIQYILNNINLKMNLEDVAKKFGMNSSYCSTQFKKYFDCGFSDFLAKIRIKKAIELLTGTDMSIEEIAIKCGYTDYYYFNKVFKRITNITPNEYRKYSRQGENK